MGCNDDRIDGIPTFSELTSKFDLSKYLGKGIHEQIQESNITNYNTLTPQILEKFIQDSVSKQQNIDPEFKQIIDDNFFNLI
jgi:hypothetical protein